VQKIPREAVSHFMRIIILKYDIFASLWDSEGEGKEVFFGGANNSSTDNWKNSDVDVLEEVG